MNFSLSLGLKSVRTFAYDRRVGSLDGRLLPAQLLSLEADPAELRAVASRITNRLPVWQAVRETLEARADELEARAARRATQQPEPMRAPGVSLLYSPWG